MATAAVHQARFRNAVPQEQTAASKAISALNQAVPAAELPGPVIRLRRIAVKA